MRDLSRRVRGGWALALCAALPSCGTGGETQAAAPDGAQFLRVEPSPEGAPASSATTDGAAVRGSSPTPNPEARGAETVRPPDATPAAASSPSVSASDELSSERNPFADRERSAKGALEAGAFASAARQYSALMLDGALTDGAASREDLRRWAAALERAQAGHRWSRKGAWPSLEITVQPGDSLIAIRARALTANPGLLISTGLIARANELPSETAIRPGDVLRIPTDRASTLVDISACWTLFLLGDEVAAAWEVGVGRDTSPTRPGDYTVGLKQKEPMWSPVGRAPVPYGDPENPLGTRWLAWFEGGKNTSLGFHGTNDAAGIGGRVSDGCVRMRNQDVEVLFEILPRDALVRVRP